MGADGPEVNNLTSSKWMVTGGALLFVGILFISAYWKNHLALAHLPRTGTLQKPVLPMDLVMKVESALRAAGAESSLSPQAQGELEALREAYAADLPQQLAGLPFARGYRRLAKRNTA